MEDKKISMGTYGGVANMEKVEMKPIQVAFMLYCLVAAGAFGTVLGIVLLAIGKKTDLTTWRGTGDWGVWASDKK